MDDAQQKEKRITKEITEKTTGYIIGAFGLVAGIAWNDAVKSLIEYLFPLAKGDSAIWLKFLYAIVITLVVVTLSFYVLRLINKDSTK